MELNTRKLPESLLIFLNGNISFYTVRQIYTLIVDSLAPNTG